MNRKSFFAILSALLIAAGTGVLCSCSLSRANEKTPVIKDSTALFDYFTYKGYSFESCIRRYALRFLLFFEGRRRLGIAV